MPIDPHYLTAQQAADALGISKPTLYAYTSRGQLRSEPVPGEPRQRRYYQPDVERLRETKDARRDPSQAAARGLHWGSPVLESAITLIDNGRIYYRGRDAIELATGGATLEHVAGLLWSADAPASEQFAHLARPPAALRSLRRFTRDPLALFQALLPLAAARDAAAFDLRPAVVRRTGARIVGLFLAAAAGRHWRKPAHAALQSAWGPRRPELAEALRQALVLCADHELNASTFAARCAASAAASPYDAVSAAMATFRGYKHGAASERVAALFEETRSPARAPAVLAARLRRGELVPGFGHRLYPKGDPRAAALLRLAESSGNRSQWRLIHSLSTAASGLLGEAPNLDFGLAALARSFKLPMPAPQTIFAIGRCVGWIAHAIEQYTADDLIRPRARYTGPLPE